MPRTDILTKEDQIRQWIAENRSLGFIAAQLKCNKITLRRYLEILSIDYKGQPNIGPAQRKKPAKYYLLKDGPFIDSTALKIKLINDELREAKCESCGLEEWMGEPIPLHLHHKNRDLSDNRDDNLEILCANCHALVHKRGQSKHCCECGTPISKFSESGLCKSCVQYGKQRKTERPQLQELLALVEEYGYLATGRIFGVSDNAIRKWIKNETKRNIIQQDKNQP